MLLASLCCGGSLLFGAVGLGAAYSRLGMARYIPQALAAGALLIVGINYWYYRRRAARAMVGDPTCPGGSVGDLRRAMLVSAALGLLLMVGSFVFLEWLHHAVVNRDRFMGPALAAPTVQSTTDGQPPAAAGAGHARASGHAASGSQVSEPSTGGSRAASAHAAGLIPGVANRNLLFALASFAAVGVLALLPFPRQPAGALGRIDTATDGALGERLRDARAAQVAQAPPGHCPW